MHLKRFIIIVAGNFCKIFLQSFWLFKCILGIFGSFLALLRGTVWNVDFKISTRAILHWRAASQTVHCKQCSQKLQVLAKTIQSLILLKRSRIINTKQLISKKCLFQSSSKFGSWEQPSERPSVHRRKQRHRWNPGRWSWNECWTGELSQLFLIRCYIEIIIYLNKFVVEIGMNVERVSSTCVNSMLF